MRALTLLLVALSACATLAHGSSDPQPSSSSTSATCPDNPPCLTTPNCTMDKVRDCLACHCSDGLGPNPGIVNSESIPPFQY